jgi:uncharacterized iron-regulated membrane protein
MIPTILKMLLKDKILLAIWLSIASLSGLVLSLPSDSHLLLLASLLEKGWIEKIALVLLLISIGLIISLFILHKKQTTQINSQTCEWIKDPPVWKHRTNGLYYCSRCAPDPSPLSSDWFCPKCSHGFGKGGVFTVDF